MFKHHANVIEELVGEPRVPAEDQIMRARDPVCIRPKRELDELTADLIERPTVVDADLGEQRAAVIFYRPN